MTDNTLYFWKPIGGYIFLVKWKGRWCYFGTGANNGICLHEFAAERNLKLVRSPGPKNIPPTLTEMKSKYPVFSEYVKR